MPKPSDGHVISVVRGMCFWGMKSLVLCLTNKIKNKAILHILLKKQINISFCHVFYIMVLTVKLELQLARYAGLHRSRQPESHGDVVPLSIHRLVS